MAWRCSGTTNQELIGNMWEKGLITDQRVKEAFLKVDRAHYAPRHPYEDRPQSIGHAATISAPHMHALAIKHVLPYLQSSSSPVSVLDIGCGSGYLTHLLAELIGDGGHVVGLEHIAALRDLSEANMRKSSEGRTLLDTGKVRFCMGDGRLGLREGDGQGWDVIHVGASAKEVHQPLLDQLKSPGCLFIPVNDDHTGSDQSVWRITKDQDGNIERERLFGVRYVPLTDAPE